MFVRVYDQEEDKEILVNVNTIWKIEVEYVVPTQSGHYAKVGLAMATKTPDAVRFYKVFFGSETVRLIAKPGDPVIAVFEEIYKNAVKGPDKLPEDGA